MEKRFVANTIFGQGVQIKQKALDLLLNWLNNNTGG
jgi:DNA polymerase III delta subunit